MKELIVALVAIPMMLLIAISVYNPFFDNSRATYETAVTAENIGNVTTNGTVITFPNYVKPDSVTSITAGNNTVAVECEDSSIIDYKNGKSLATFTAYCNNTGSSVGVYVTYTAYSGSGYDTALKTNTGTYSGFSLGSQLPFIYIAIAVISVILGAFGITRVFGA